MSKKDQRVALLAGQRRDRDQNRATQIVGAAAVAPPGDFKAAFLRHYASFRDHVKAFEQPGVAVVAIDRRRERVGGVACIAARIGAPNGIIAGRHSGAQLLLDGDATLSLRHLAVIVEPLTDFRPGRGITYRIMDLRSSCGLRSEDGKVLAGIRSDGPAFLATGSYLFLFFVTGDPTDWPDSATDAWSFVPERVFLEERLRGPDGSGMHRQAPRRFPVSVQRSITLVERIAAPSRAGAARLVREDEEQVAELTVIGPDSAHRLAVGPRVIEDGILLGRADRCESAAVLQHGFLSRVHLLLLAIDGDVYAFDTASTNGCYRAPDGEDPFDLRRLDAEDTIYLGTQAAVRWRWAH